MRAKHRVHKYDGAPCAVPGCQQVARDNWMCAVHGQRVRRYGDPYFVTSREERATTCRSVALSYKIAKPTSYRKIHGRHEHRVVMECHLGRRLHRWEIVHHKDGNRHNNQVSNLELMTQSDHINEHRNDLNSGRRRKLCKP